MSFKVGQDVEARMNPAAAHAGERAGKYLLYEVAQNAELYLPAAELPAEPTARRHFLRLLESGQLVTVRVLDYDEASGHYVVSRQEVLLGDPWRDKVPFWMEKEPVQRMRVTNVHNNWVYGTIVPGVAGTVSLETVKEYLGKDEVLIGDSLIGYVTQPDSQHFVVPLDVRGYLHSLNEEKAEPLKGPPSAGFSADWGDDVVPRPPFRTVLVVDDDARYLRALKQILEKDGLTVVSANGPEEMDRVFRGSAPHGGGPDGDGPQIDVALIDLTLGPGEESVDGIKLAARVRQERPEIRVLLMSGDSTVSEKLKLGDKEKLTVHGFLSKPFGVRRLRAELARVAASQPARASSFASARAEAVGAEPFKAEYEAASRIETRVRAFARAIGADYAVLFAINRITLLTDVKAGHKPAWNPAQGYTWPFWRQKLGRSPVRDVAIDKIAFLESNAKESSREAVNRWLQRAYGYRSCLGVPLETNEQQALCLFAFHSSPDKFSQAHLQSAAVYASELAAIIEKERVLRVLENQMRYVTSGMALGALAHELRNRIGAALLGARSLLDEVRKPDLSREEVLQGVTQVLENVELSASICANVMELASPGTVNRFRVRDAIEKAMRMVYDLADRHETSIYLEDGVGADLWVEAPPVALEQVLFNLFLNAAEQSRGFGKRKGLVGVSAIAAGEGKERRVQISVKDNGPGIHYCWWEKIFDAGFTTKGPTGSGLGLHVCRSILKKLSGTVAVQTSDLWAGTTFVVSLPASGGPP
jgi:signal transduction histidine kinase/CheY-like chemotaxis protein